MDKTLFKEYEEWCVRENKDPLNEETFREFKSFKAKEDAKKMANSEEEHKKVLLTKQEEIFNLLCDYCGVKTKYDASYMFDAIDGLIKSVVMASVTCNKAKDVEKVLEKLI